MTTETYRGYKITTFCEERESPRLDFRVGNILSYHRRYRFTDNDLIGTALDIAENVLDIYGMDDEKVEDYLRIEYKAQYVFPLYMYDHGQIDLSLGEYNCRFDSGKVGYFYITESADLDTTEMSLEEIKSMVEAELDEYVKWINGETYAYRIEEIKECSHCGGCEYGEPYYNSCYEAESLEDAMDEAKKMVDSFLEGI